MLVLDVKDPSSPYGLIHNVLSPNSIQSAAKIKSQYINQADLGGLDRNEVWLSQGNLLVLKGTTTSITFLHKT